MIDLDAAVSAVAKAEYEATDASIRNGEGFDLDELISDVKAHSVFSSDEPAKSTSPIFERRKSPPPAPLNTAIASSHAESNFVNRLGERQKELFWSRELNEPFVLDESSSSSSA